MFSLNRSYLLCIFASAVCFFACDAEPEVATAPIQNVGLVQNASVPPLGVGVAPVLGLSGDGSAVVTGAGTSVGGVMGPSAVRWHGGQWLVPYTGTAGATVQNVSCDVNPSATATDTIDLVSSNGSVLGSSIVPAATGVTIRSWIVLSGGHKLADGEQIVMRHSPKDSMTGAWTSAAQDVTVIGCSVNATIAATPRTITKAILLTDVVATAGSVGVTTVIPVSSVGVTAGDVATFYIRFPDLPSDNQISGVTLGFSHVNSRANSTVSIASTGAGDPAGFTFVDLAGSTLSNSGTAQKSISGLSISPSPGQVFYLKVSTGSSGWGSSTLTSMSVGVNAP